MRMLILFFEGKAS